MKEIVYNNHKITITTGKAWDFDHDRGRWYVYTFRAFDVVDLSDNFTWTSGSAPANMETQKQLIDNLKKEIDLLKEDKNAN